MVIKYKASDLISDFNLNAKTTLTELSELFGTEIKKSTVLQRTRQMLPLKNIPRKAK